MTTPLRALLVDDSRDDAALISRELTRAGFAVQSRVVADRNAMREALESERWDVVLSDYSMPGFGGELALSLVKELELDVPFIVVSGTIGEEVAVAMLKAGAHDFVLKESLGRLAPAIERELREASRRAQQRAMQKQLLIADRMASLGTVAASVAHEINNPLTSVVSSLEQALLQLRAVREGTAPTESLDVVEHELGFARDGAERVRRIVRDLKVLSHPESDDRTSTDIESVVESALRIAATELARRARVVRAYQPVPRVLGNESRLGQVFLNLLINAAQAIEGAPEDNEIRVSIAQANQRVVVEVADTGKGIPPAAMDQVFNAFYTTKPVGVGTGLGLSICHRIVTELGGEITAANGPDRGAIFRVLLPLADQLQPASPTTSTTPPRRGKVLVVDDEPSVTRAVTNILQPEHDVQAVNAGVEALEIVGTGAFFDVILCDLMMPNMTGPELYTELLKVSPSYADTVIFMTGGAFVPEVRQFLADTARPVLEKPFNVADLRSFVNGRLR